MVAINYYLRVLHAKYEILIISESELSIQLGPFFLFYPLSIHLMVLFPIPFNV